MIWGGAEAVLLALGSGCHCLQLPWDVFQLQENKLMAPDSALWWAVWSFYYIYNAIIIAIKGIINIMHLSLPKTFPSLSPGPWKNCLPWNWSLVRKGWGPLGWRTENVDEIQNLPFLKFFWPSCLCCSFCASLPSTCSVVTSRRNNKEEFRAFRTD